MLRPIDDRTAPGRVVSRVISVLDDMVITFMDDAFMLIRACQEYDSSPTPYVLSVEEAREEIYSHAAMEEGIITEDDLKEHIACNAKAFEQQERERYEILRRKFEGR